jgi:hypothetical protein
MSLPLGNFVPGLATIGTKPFPDDPKLFNTLFGTGFRVEFVGQGYGMHHTLQAAVDAVNAWAVPPAVQNRAVIFVTHGYYELAAAVTIPANTTLVGVSKGAVQFHAASTGLFVCGGDNVFLENFLIEGAAVPAAAAIDCNGKNGAHVRNVDMLNNGGTCQQLFLVQSGTAWKTLFIERCVVDSYRTSDYAIKISNTSGAARFVDVEINDLFLDVWHLTALGGGVILSGVQDVRFKSCKIRGGNSSGTSSSYFTGVYLRANGATGTSWMTAHACVTEGFHGVAAGVGVYGEANTDYLLTNCDALGSLTAGTRTLRNSSVT